MKNVSNEFRKTMNTRTDFYMKSDVVFADGTEKELTRENFYLSGNSYTDAAGSSSFPLGVALEKQIQISLVNDKDQFSKYDFYGAKFTVYCCLDLDSGTTEKILLGTFTVTEPETYGSIITVNAVDDMYKGDKDYSTGLTFPMTAGQALRDSCSACGVTLLDTTFTNDDYVIAEMPEGITHRALWGQCAMLAGGNARMDEYNRLRIISYDFSLFDRAGLNGGVFDADNPYSSGDTADGGSFDPWDVGAVIDGGTFNEAKDYHVFWKAKNLTVATDDVVITGIQTTVDDETYRFGEEGYILSVTNQLIEGNPQDAVNRIGALIVGARFRPFSMDHTAYPLAEVGDVCFVVDRKQNTYQAIVTDVNFTFFGFTTLQCQADSPIRNSSKYNSQLTQAIVQARINTDKKISAYDKEVQMMTSIMSNSMGMYESKEQTESGGVIVYQHNKPTLEESDIIWKKSEQGFQVSTDGGKTWNAGMTADGRAVVNVLAAVGILFDWARGGTLTLGGPDNGDGLMSVLNALGIEVVRVDKDGAVIKNGMLDISGIGDGTFIVRARNSSYLAGITPSGIVCCNTESKTYTEIASNMVSAGSFSGDDPVSGSSQPKAIMFPDGQIISTYAYDTTTTDSANVNVFVNGLFRRTASSSRRYKKNITDQLSEELNPDKLYDLPVRSFRYKPGYLGNGDQREDKDIIGLIVEELDEIYPIAVNHDEKGRPEMWNAQILIPAMLKLIQEQNERIIALEKAVNH